jgi:hypothetical protein
MTDGRTLSRRSNRAGAAALLLIVSGFPVNASHAQSFNDWIAKAREVDAWITDAPGELRKAVGSKIDDGAKKLAGWFGSDEPSNSRIVNTTRDVLAIHGRGVGALAEDMKGVSTDPRSTSGAPKGDQFFDWLGQEKIPAILERVGLDAAPPWVRETVQELRTAVDNAEWLRVKAKVLADMGAEAARQFEAIARYLSRKAAFGFEPGSPDAAVGIELVDQELSQQRSRGGSLSDLIAESMTWGSAGASNPTGESGLSLLTNATSGCRKCDALSDKADALEARSEVIRTALDGYRFHAEGSERGTLSELSGQLLRLYDQRRALGAMSRRGSYAPQSRDAARGIQQPDSPLQFSFCPPGQRPVPIRTESQYDLKLRCVPVKSQP